MKNYSESNNNAVSEKLRVMPEVCFFPKRVYPKYDENQKERAGVCLKCVAGHSGAHVIESGLNWEKY